jgi:hypothetical protein
VLDCFLAGLSDGCCPSCDEINTFCAHEKCISEGSKRVKLFLERIHASLLVQLSHGDDSLIPYAGCCIYRKGFGVHIARKLRTYAGCMDGVFICMLHIGVSGGLVEDEISRLQQCMHW